MAPLPSHPGEYNPQYMIRPNYIKKRVNERKKCIKLENLPEKKTQIEQFIENNKREIEEKWFSTNMTWLLDIEHVPDIIYSAGYWRNKPDEVLFFDTYAESTIYTDNKTNDIITGCVFAFKNNESNQWEFLELNKSKSNYVCDACRQDIKIGDWRCMDCNDYDLCDACYNCASHDDTHTFKQVYIGAWGLNTYDSIQCLLKLTF